MSPHRTPAVSVVVSAGLDVAFVVIFVLIGRGNHNEGFSPAGLVTTLWPFLAGLGIGWAAMRAWRSPRRVVWTGIGLWIATVAAGMLLRAASGQGTALSFVVVATLVLGIFLIGWRAIAAFAARRRAVAA